MKVKGLIYVTEKYVHEKKLHLILADTALALLDALSLHPNAAVQGATLHARALSRLSRTQRDPRVV